MILGVGIDLLNVYRVKRLFNKFSDNKFANKILSTHEMDVFNNIIDIYKKINFLAKKFSSKESLLKAIGIGLGRGIGLTDISILNDELGKPSIVLNKYASEFLSKMYNIDYNNIVFNISITDESNLINSIVIISCKNDK